MQPYEGRGRDEPYYPFPMKAVTRKAPRDYLIWSLLTFSYANCCCLGLVALVFSIKSRDCKVTGDPENAAEHGKTARCLNVVALILAVLVFLILTILFVTSMTFFYKKFQSILNDVHDTNTNEPIHGN